MSCDYMNCCLLICGQRAANALNSYKMLHTFNMQRIFFLSSFPILCYFHYFSSLVFHRHRFRFICFGAVVAVLMNFSYVLFCSILHSKKMYIRNERHQHRTISFGSLDMFTLKLLSNMQSSLTQNQSVRFFISSFIVSYIS